MPKTRNCIAGVLGYTRSVGKRLLSILIALWWFTWVCLVVPAHTRGAIGLDGSSARTDDGRSVSLFFSAVRGCCQPKTHNTPSRAPRGANCVICKTTAIPGAVPGTIAVPVPLECIAATVVSLPPQVENVDFLPTLQGRAPPQLAS